MLAVAISTAGGRAVAVRKLFDKESSVYTVEATEEGGREGVGK